MAIDDTTGEPATGRSDGGAGGLVAGLAAVVGERLTANRSTAAAVRSRVDDGLRRAGVRSADSTEEDEVTVDPDRLRAFASVASQRAETMADVVEQRTVDVDETIDEDVFFTTAAGATTLTNRYDLEKAVPTWHKAHFREVERYWVNEPYAFVVIFHARRENETKYYLVEPHLTEREEALCAFLTEKLRATLEYGKGSRSSEGDEERARVIEQATRRLLDRYGLYDGESTDGSPLASLRRYLPRSRPGPVDAVDEDGRLDGLSARPAPALIEADDATLTEYQVRKLLYYLRRDFVGYERIDGIKQDVNVEDVSCDGYDSRVFVYHSTYENLITNVGHGREELDDFVVKLAQRSGKAISKRQPQVDATLPDGSRAQLTLGREVADHGTNYTIRQFRDVPFTPVDLINWRTFSLEQMAYFWLAIENGRSMLFAGGTASGKTTSLNAMSLFVPSNAKIVSIEDTREVELPHRNWIASVTRPTLSATDAGDIDEFDLLEAALRQRPDYIVMGEVRGEEGRTLFQVMSTGHTTYTTFHAGSVEEVIKRFTTDPINVSKTLFTSLDVVSVQTKTRLGDRQVRRNQAVTEVTDYDPATDEIYTSDVYRWNAETDAFEQAGRSGVLEAVAENRGWGRAELQSQLFERRVILAYLVDRGLDTYAEVAATIQAYLSDPELTLSLVAADALADHLDDLRRMENVRIDIDHDTEASVARPEPDEETRERARSVLATAEQRLFPDYRDDGPDVESLFSASPSESDNSAEATEDADRAPSTLARQLRTGGD